MKQFVLASLLAMVCASPNASVSAADPVKNDWPRFRGPTGDGLSPAKGIPTTWSKDQNVLWAADLPKAFKIVPRDITVEQPRDLKESGSKADMESQAFNPYSSPIVSGGKVFVATSGIRTSEHRLLCFSLAAGAPLWETAIPPGPVAEMELNQALEPKTRGRTNFGHRYGYNCTTPCADGERVYVTFGTGILAAVDYQGKLVWQKPIVELRGKDLGRQPADSMKYVNLCIATSPILYRDLVIQICDNGGGGPEHLPEGETRDDYKNKPSSVMAFDCKTGELKYRGDRTGDSISWSTPILVTFNGKTVLVHKNSRAAEGIDPDNGKVVWGLRVQQNVRTSLVYGAGFVYSAGEGPSSMAFTLDAGSTGDITKNVKWTFPYQTGLGGYCSPVIVDGTMYRYVAGGGKRARGSDEATPLIGKLYCVELATGKQVHVLDMPGFTNWASPVATADGYIYFATGTKSYVIKAGPKPEIVGVNDLGDYNPAPSPAVADGKLIIRGSSKLWCIGKP